MKQGRDGNYEASTIGQAIKDPDIYATIFRVMGISPKHSYEIEQRPFYVTRDGLGKPMDSLFA